MGWQGVGVREHACLAFSFEFCEFCSLFFSLIGTVVLSWVQGMGHRQSAQLGKDQQGWGRQRGGLQAGFGCMSAAEPRCGGLEPAGPLCHLLGPTHAAQTRLAFKCKKM